MAQFILDISNTWLLGRHNISTFHFGNTTFDLGLIGKNNLKYTQIHYSENELYGFEVYMARHGALSKYTHFSVITQLKDKYQPNWLEKTYFAWRHISFQLLPSKSRLFQLRIYTCYTKTCFYLGVTCYFSRITYFWSIVLFRCNDFIRSLYYFWTIPKTL